ncbi:MAG: hypothetical protein QXX51_02535 [Candidatus Bathyarchaeia archaeon]
MEIFSRGSMLIKIVRELTLEDVRERIKGFEKDFLPVKEMSFIIR